MNSAITNEEEHKMKIVRAIRKIVILTIFLTSYIVLHRTDIIKRSNTFKEVLVALLITILAIMIIEMTAGLILTIKFYIESHKKSKMLKDNLSRLNFTVDKCQEENLMTEDKFKEYIEKLICYEIDNEKYCIKISNKQINEILHTYSIYLRTNKIYFTEQYIYNLIQQVERKTNGEPRFVLGIFTEKCDDFMKYTLFGNEYF